MSRHFTSLAAAAAVVGAVAGGAVVVPAPPASAAPCPDVRLLFARGTTEAPGVGPIGQAFADGVIARAAPRSVEVVPIDYPASLDFPRALDGIRDARAKVLQTVAECPDTKIVLGGFSQGAAVAGFVTADVVPAGAVGDIPQPLEAAAVEHIAAVELFGKPNERFMRRINQPPVVIGPAFADKAAEYCAVGDPVCSDGGDLYAHSQYIANGMTAQAADVVVARLDALPQA